jgi:hypothetical protein
MSDGADGFNFSPKEVVITIFIALKKSIILGRVWNREPWVKWQAR